MPGTPGSASRARIAAAALAFCGLATLGTGAVVMTGAAATADVATTSAVVVKVSNRPPYGYILTNVLGRSLYTTNASCTGSCLQIWPPLLMPKGTTVPKGVGGLGTKPFGSGRLQVTYHSKRLYTFVDDSGSSVNGNGVGGFVVAKLVKTT